MLPYIELQQIYSQHNMKASWNSPVNAATIANYIPNLLCPSSTSAPRWQAFPSDHAIANGVNGRLGLSPYNLMRPIPGYDPTNPSTDATQYTGAILPMNTISSFTTGMNPPFYNKRPKNRLLGSKTQDARCSIAS